MEMRRFLKTGRVSKVRCKEGKEEEERGLKSPSRGLVELWSVEMRKTTGGNR